MGTSDPTGAPKRAVEGENIGVEDRIEEVEAATEDEARQQLKSRLSQIGGRVVFQREEILTRSAPNESRGWAATVENAHKLAEAAIPSNALIVSKEILAEPGVRTLRVEAWSYADAEQEALKEAVFPQSALVESAKHTGGLRGLFNCFRGRRRSIFEVKVRQKATVLIHV